MRIYVSADIEGVALAALAAIIPEAERIAPRTRAFPRSTVAGAVGWVTTLSHSFAVLR